MGAERVVRWGPPTLSQVVTDQLWRHGLGSADAAACARELAAAVGPAARASSFVDLGGCRFLDGDISGALAAWQQAIISGQTAPAARALFNLGLLHEHLGLYEEAAQRFEAAEEHGVAPYSALATLGRARSQHRSGDNDRAMASLARHADRLMEDEPDNPLLAETLLALGDVAEEAGQLDRAEQAYRAAMTANDESVREHASLSLVDVLRFIGHDEEAQQIVEDTGLAVADPVVALDRVELLIRLGRFDEAEAVLDELESDKLAVADQFRLTTIQIDLGRVNDAIDILEERAGHGAPETRARAAYRLGEVYADHDMAEPAATMFGNVRGIQPGYWADKASLVLGDLAMAEGRHRIAAAHWADAAASRIESVSTSARDRLVDAVVAPPAPVAPAEPVASEPAPSLTQPSFLDNLPAVFDDAGPATEAVDMVAVLDDVPPAADQLDVPGEITPVAGVLMSIPVADAVDVVVPAEPIATEPPATLMPTPAPDQVAASEPEPAPAAPVVPTVIPLRRRSTTSEPKASAELGLDVPHPPAAAPTLDETGANGQSSTNGSESTETAIEPVVVKLGRGRSSAESDSSSDLDSSSEAAAPPEPVIDLREGTESVSNPYADLAPEALEDDPEPSPRNPYAELAPNFGRDPLADGEDEPGPSTFSRFA